MFSSIILFLKHTKNIKNFAFCTPKKVGRQTDGGCNKPTPFFFETFPKIDNNTNKIFTSLGLASDKDEHSTTSSICNLMADANTENHTNFKKLIEGVQQEYLVFIATKISVNCLFTQTGTNEDTSAWKHGVIQGKLQYP